ncbi:MAG: protein kinase [Deltaproteobacteria bacterium]|nr:protein kinase [Deltaproteobacteria bacterium]
MTKSGNHPPWRPPAGTQSLPGAGGNTVATNGDGLAHAMTVRADKIIGEKRAGAKVGAFGETLAGDTIIGERYVIEQHISSGSFGAVYKARDESIDNHAVALKVLHGQSTTEKARETALRELQLIASVSHPSVVQFKDYGWIGDTLWFTMPWYDGTTLDQRLASREKGEQSSLSRIEARPIFERLAHGLAAMHEVGVFHSDIKPENIFLATVSGFEGGLPVLLDLGIAAKRGEKPTGFTAQYVSPETASAAAGEQVFEIGAAADVFSLALALRNALEPETATSFDGNHFDFLKSRATKPVEPPKSRDLRYLASSFRRWLSVDPDKRPTAKAFADELSELTVPEDRRQSRIQLARRLVPIVLLAGALVSMLVYQLTRKEEQLIEQEERLSETNEELSKKSIEADLLAYETAEQQEQLKTESARAAKSERKAKKLDRKLERTSKAQSELSLQLDELQVVHLDLLAQHEALNEEINELRGERDGLTAERGELLATNKTLQTERDELQKARDTAKTEIDTLKKQNDIIRQKIDNLKKKLEDLKTKKSSPQVEPATIEESESS